MKYRFSLEKQDARRFLTAHGADIVCDQVPSSEGVWGWVDL